MPSINKIAIAFNLKGKPKAGQPQDHYAECDDISVPLAIKVALEDAGYEANILEADEHLFGHLQAGGYDLVFNIAEGVRGRSRESQVPAMLEMLGIPYTGSDVLTQAITLDKRRTKEILLHYGVETPHFQVFTSSKTKLRPDLSFPLIVKPNAEGSSKGIRNDSVVHDEAQLRTLLKFVIDTYKQPALVEDFLDGREFTVSVLGNNPPKVLPIVEVDFDELPAGLNRIDSYEVKWIWDNPDNPVDGVICPARIPAALEKDIRRTALTCFKVLDIHDLCRIDMRLDAAGVPHVLEINALPGLMPDPAENSRFPKACYAAGMSYGDIVLAIVEGARMRYGLSKKRAVGRHTSPNAP